MNNHNDIEDGELDKEEFPKKEESNGTEYIKRVPMVQWQSRTADLYKKIDLVGEGTFGKVFKAKYNPPVDTKSKQANQAKEPPVEHVALKKILMDNEKEGFPITAIREIMILKRLSHKNIIKLLEIVTSKPSDKNKNRGSVYLVFEYMEHDLAGLADRNIDFKVPQIKCILHQILSGVNYMHMNNIIHRDIKGANILINNKGDIKIADFGLARIHNPLNKMYTNRVVTLWYRAPELLLGAKNYGPAIDVWSVGCVFSELLMGTPLFRGNKDPEQLEKIFEKMGTPNDAIWPGLSTLPNYNALMPKTKYPNILKIYYTDCKKMDDLAYDLLTKMLELDPHKRISAKEALEHPYFTTDPQKCQPEDLPRIEKDSHEYQSRQDRQKKQQSNQQQQRPNNPNRNDNLVPGGRPPQFGNSNQQQKNIGYQGRQDVVSVKSNSNLEQLLSSNNNNPQDETFLHKKRAHDTTNEEVLNQPPRKLSRNDGGFTP